MSIFSGTIFSETLHMGTMIGVILPQDVRSRRVFDDTQGHGQGKPKTLILLHGLSDNWAAWPYRSRILSYAESHGVAVIMPEVQRSFYQDMLNGERYFQYVANELPLLAADLFNISVAPDDLMVAGLSMGGYGALRCALTYPDRYCAVGAFSSACWIESLMTHAQEEHAQWDYAPMVRGMFGNPPVIPEDAKIKTLAKRAAGSRLPIMMTCGTEDGLYPGNQAMFEELKADGFNVTFDAWPGVHEWGFWDKSISMFLDRFAK